MSGVDAAGKHSRERICIVGGGLMGASIALVFAAAGHQVVVFELLADSRTRSAKMARFRGSFSGAVTVELGDGTIETLGPLDSCLIPAGEARAVRNEGNDMATMLVVMPYPQARP